MLHGAREAWPMRQMWIELDCSRWRCDGGGVVSEAAARAAEPAAKSRIEV